jgi:hypothetical protein
MWGGLICRARSHAKILHQPDDEQQNYCDRYPQKNRIHKESTGQALHADTSPAHKRERSGVARLYSLIL